MGEHSPGVFVEQPDEGEVQGVIEGRRAAFPPLVQITQQMREGRGLPPLVAGLIAWSITVAPVGFGRGASALSAILALGGLVSTLAGPLLLTTRPRLGSHFGISLFVGFSTCVWLANSVALQSLRLEPVRGAYGAIAWGVFAVSWSDRWGKTPAADPPDPDVPALHARSTLAPLAAPIVGLGIAAGIGYLVFAFQIRDPDRALLAQAIALLCAVMVVSAAAMVATARGKHRSSSNRRLSSSVVRALLLLLMFALVGAMVTALR
jgi:hypothetical protein